MNQNQEEVPVEQDKAGRPPSGPGSRERSPSVSALRAAIPDAWKAFLSWAFPFVSVMVGVACVAAANSDDGMAGVAQFVVGCVFLLGALDAKAGRAKAAETERWANVIGDMIRDERKVKINVNHTWESMRPHLDARIAELVAQAMSAREGQDPQGLGAEPASAVAEGHAPNPGDHHG